MGISGLIDVTLIIVLLVGTVMGYRRGFIRQVLDLAGLVISFLLALFFAGVVASYLNSDIGIPYTPALVIGFIAIFIAGVLLFHFLAVILQKMINWTLLGWIDRLTGALLGIIMGMVVASLLISFMLAVPLPSSLRSGFERSQVSEFLRPVAPRIFNLIFNHGSRKINFDKFLKKSDSA
jgi:uncharacterized membrane protein required for colicin V production